MSEQEGHLADPVRLGDHLCLLYQTDEEQAEFLRAFLREGIDHGEKLVYASGAPNDTSIENSLRDSVPEFATTRPGQLTVLHLAQCDLRTDERGSEQWVDLLRREVEEATRQGFPGARVTVEMPGSHGCGADRRLLDYESRLNDLLPGSSCAVLCLYDQRRFDSTFLLSAMAAHPLVVSAGRVHRNLYYMPPSEAQGPGRYAPVLRQWLDNLQAHTEACEGWQRTVDALRTREYQYDLLAANVSDVIWTLNMDLELTYVSPSVSRIYGASPDQVREWGLTGLLTPDSLARAMELLAEELAVEGSEGANPQRFRTCDFELYRDDASTFWIESGMSFLRNGDGEAVGILGVSRDITERRQTANALRVANDELEESVQLRTRELQAANDALRDNATGLEETNAALQSSQDRFRGLVESLSDVVWEMDTDQRVTYVSPRMSEVLGARPEAIVGMGPAELLPGVEAASLRECLEAMEAGGCLGHVIKVEQDNGRRRLIYLELSCRRICSHEGLPLGWRGTIRDVTDARLAEEALQRRDAVLAAVSSAGRAFMSAAGWESCIGDVLRMLGEAAGVSRACLWRTYLDGETHWCADLRAEWTAPGIPPLKSKLTGVRSTEELRLCSRWAADLPEGRVMCGKTQDFPPEERELLEAIGVLSVVAVPIFVGGLWWGFMSYQDCLTQREWSPAGIDAIRASASMFGAAEVHRQIKERWEEAVRELQRSNEELEQFAYVASHDLREPLRVIAGSLQLLEQRGQGELPGDAAELMRHAIESSMRLSAMVDALLTYSRMGASEGALEDVDLNVVVKEAIRSLRPEISEQAAEVTRDELPVVGGRPSLLLELLQNLISNAVKFSGDEPPRVHVSARRQEDEWVIAVRDNGIGIAREHMQCVFDMFRRLHSRATYPGTGIGLALCRKIVESHGGRIWVESQLGAGSTFYVALPSRKD